IDVYEWRANGAGGCAVEAGCIDLISSGRSAGDDYLFAMTPNGSDVFFQSGDVLLPEDPDGTPSIYDPRGNGGLPPPPHPLPACEGDACQAAAPGSPPLPGAGGSTSAVPQDEGNVHGRAHIGKKGKQKKKKKRHGNRRRGHGGPR